MILVLIFVAFAWASHYVWSSGVLTGASLFVAGLLAGLALCRDSMSIKDSTIDYLRGIIEHFDAYAIEAVETKADA